MIEIPLNSSPSQLFSINLNGVNYNVEVNFNSRVSNGAGEWFISFYIGETPVITGVGVVGGIDILGQYDLGIKNMYVVNVVDGESDPTATSLGTDARLFILTDEEL